MIVRSELVCDEVTEFQSDESFSLTTPEEQNKGGEGEDNQEKEERTEITMKEHVYLGFCISSSCSQ